MLRLLAVTWLCVCSGFANGVAAHQQQPYPSIVGTTDTSVVAESFQAPNPLTLDQAIELALQHNPLLSASQSAVMARRSLASQAGARPNPALTLEAENVGGTGPIQGFDSGEFTAGLSQAIELGRKRSLRTDAAMAEVEISEWDFQTAKLDVIHQTSERFFSLLASQHRLNVSDSLWALSKRFSTSVSERRKAGKVSMLHERRANILAATANIQREAAARKLTEARNLLQEMWGRRGGDFTSVEEQFDTLFRLPELDSLLEDVESYSMSVSAERFIDHARAELKLQRAMSIPDIEVSAGVRRIKEIEASGATVSVGIPLPLFNRNRRAVEAAEHELQRAEALKLAIQSQLQTQILNGYAEVASFKTEATMLGQSAVPDATQNLIATIEGYENGKFDLLAVLDAQRVLFELTNQHIDALLRFHTARLNLERLVAASFESLTEERHNND